MQNFYQKYMKCSVFIKLLVGKVDSHTQVVPNVLESFPVTKLSINFKFTFKVIKMK